MGDVCRFAEIRREIAGLAAKAEASLVHIASVLEQPLAALGRLHSSAGAVPESQDAPTSIVQQTLLPAAPMVTDRLRWHVGEAMDALQIGDCTRQRLEHSEQALALIDPDCVAEPTNPVVSQVICGLMSAQLSDVADAFEREAERLALALTGLTTSIPTALLIRRQSGDSFEVVCGSVINGLLEALSLVEITRPQIGPVVRESAERLAAKANVASQLSPSALFAAKEMLEQIEVSYAIAQEQVVHDRFLGRPSQPARSSADGRPPNLDALLF